MDGPSTDVTTAARVIDLTEARAEVRGTERSEARVDAGTEAARDAGHVDDAEAPDQQRPDHLLTALREIGLDPQAAAALRDAALVMGAIAQGRPVASVQLEHRSPSAALADDLGRRPRESAAPRSMEAHLRDADTALTAVEAIASTTARLESALLVATQEQTVSVGAALLAQRDVSDPGELSRTARERWRARAKRRTREEVAPAIGWTAGETVHLVGVANAPLSFSVPVISQMSRGQLPWRLARSLWRACEGMATEHATHVATALCGDDPTTCVPERLGPDGEVLDSPWDHRAFYLALAREVAKITGADDADPDDAAQARARREAAYAARRVYASVDEDGTGSVTLITSALWAASIKDRLTRAARAARAAGDARTLDQLQSDIARALLAHATLGYADLPRPDLFPGAEESSARPQSRTEGSEHQPSPQAQPGSLHDADPASSDLPSHQAQPYSSQDEPAASPDQASHPEPLEPTEDDEPSGRGRTAEDLARTGWTPELMQTLSNLPPAQLQVIVPLMGLHSPGAAHLLPGLGRAAGTGTIPGNVAGEGSTADAEAEIPHTGTTGCPACRDRYRPGSPDPGGAPPAGDPARHRTPPRPLWVGEVLGEFGMFLSPEQVRALALAPGTTMSRLLTDPADGRCVERSSSAYLMDAAMRAQLLAADVVCRAPGCHQPGVRCQVDHVVEHGTPGGVTSESNGQLVHPGHHEAKTAKDWDAELRKNRDVEWTTLLGRVYRTRTWDYRRYVTLLVDAIDTVRSAPEAERADELNRQVYLALTLRELGERLNPGDDERDPDTIRFEGWPRVALTHRDPGTGARTPGPTRAAQAEVLAHLASTQDPGPRVDNPSVDTPSPTPASPPSGITAQAWMAQIDRRHEAGEDPPPF